MGSGPGLQTSGYEKQGALIEELNFTPFYYRHLQNRCFWALIASDTYTRQCEKVFNSYRPTSLSWHSKTCLPKQSRPVSLWHIWTSLSFSKHAEQMNLDFFPDLQILHLAWCFALENAPFFIFLFLLVGRRYMPVPAANKFASLIDCCCSMVLIRGVS